jgi:hypothetical protein
MIFSRNHFRMSCFSRAPARYYGETLRPALPYSASATWGRLHIPPLLSIDVPAQGRALFVHIM